MPKVRGLMIKYENQTYFSGETLRGWVKFELEAPMKAEAVVVDINGNTKTEWRNNKGDGLMFEGIEIYLKNSFILWRGERLEAGRHSFPFNVEIPANAASSFHYPGSATTQYDCSARISTGKFFKYDERVAANFNVIARCDLNAIPNAERPLKRQEQFETRSRGSNSGRVTFAVALPRSGFLSGERVPLTVNVSNQTAKRARLLKINMVQLIKLEAYGGVFLKDPNNPKPKKKFKDVTVMDKDFELAVDAHCDRSLVVEFKIPPYLPPTQLECKLVQINYELVLRLVHQSDSLETRLPLILGSVPFQNEPAVPARFDLDPPPSYDEVMK